MARVDHEVSLPPVAARAGGRQPHGTWAPTTKPGYEMLATMEESEAEDAAVDEACNEPGLTKAGSALPSGWVTRQVTTLAMPKAGPRAWIRPSNGSNIEPSELKA
jgi:hypothetical protein